MNTHNNAQALIIAYNDLNNSGVPNVIYQTIKALSAEYAFDIIVFGDNDYYFEKLKEEHITDIRLIRFHESRPNGIIKRLLWRFFSRGRMYYNDTLRLLEDNKYDLVHSFKEYDSWPFFKACAKKGINKRIFHCNVIHERKGNIIQRILQAKNKRLSLKYATCLIGVSNLCCSKAFDKRPYQVVYNSYNEDLFNESVTNELRENELVITHLASFNSNKNQLFTIAVFEEIQKLYHDAKLVLIGRETEVGYLDRIKEAVASKSLTSYVEIRDGSFGIGDAFLHTTFTILPSIKEGAGITVIESQACGIRAFVSDTVSTEMNIGGIIFLCLSSGPKLWAQAIIDEFEKNGNLRHKYDLSRFSKAAFKKSLLTIYKA